MGVDLHPLGIDFDNGMKLAALGFVFAPLPPGILALYRHLPSLKKNPEINTNAHVQ